MKSMHALAVPLEDLFDRFRREGEPALLAEVFDRTAPDLLRVAIHLASDAAGAEDLVQATFVTAIESAATFDATRLLIPWLAGILANHARMDRRRARRDESLAPTPRSDRTPLDEAENRETSQALVRALDEIAEPYRQVLILRLRHGVKPADIAHVLGRSPGAVRIQLHRGLRMLRRVLPAGLVAGALVAIPQARGLAAVRAAILTKAAVGASGKIVAATLLGGLVAMKKALVVVAVVLLTIVAWLFVRGNSSRVDSSAALRDAIAEPKRGRDTAGATEAAPSRERSAPPVADEHAVAATATLLHGRVVDGDTEAPLAGAAVRLYSPRRTRLLDLERSSLDVLSRSRFGSVTPWASIPTIPRTLSPLMRLDEEEFETIDAPTPGVEPFATTQSDERGDFRVAIPPRGGLVVADHAGYGERTMPVANSSTEVTVRLWPARRLSGWVIDADGTRVEQMLRFAFASHFARPNPENPGLSQSEPIGTWVFDTRRDGSFDVEVPLPSVQAHCGTPGWVITNRGIHPEKRTRWAFQSTFRPGKETEPSLLVVERIPILRVRDASTGAPIESFSLLARDSNGYVQWSGKYFAPNGELSLGEERLGGERTRQHCAFTVSSDGYVPLVLDAVDLGSPTDVEASLVRGESPAARGFVRRSAAPVAGARAFLLAVGKLQWTPGQGAPVDTTLTSDDGGFTLHAAAGDYALHVVAGDAEHCEFIAVPAASPIVVDLDGESSLTASVRDSEGAVAPGVPIFVVSQGRQLHGDTDERGRATFPSLPPGTYTVRATYEVRKGHGAFFMLDERVVDLAAADRRVVELRVPSGPRHVRLVVEGAPSPSGFEVRDGVVSVNEWEAVGIDGTIAMDLRNGTPSLEVREPGGRSWTFVIPKEPPEGYEVRVSLDGLAYEGMLVDFESGEPLAGVRVRATPSSSSDESRGAADASTDASGRFRIAGLTNTTYRLSFLAERFPGDERRHTKFWDDEQNLYMGVWFDFKTKPSNSPASIRIRIPAHREGQFAGTHAITVSGHVKDAHTGAPLSDAWVWITSIQTQGDGNLRLGPLEPTGRTSPDGVYRARVAAASRYAVQAGDGRNESRKIDVEFAATSDGDETHDLEIP